MEFVSLQEWLFHRQLVTYIYIGIGVVTFLCIYSKQKLIEIPNLVSVALALLSIYLIGSFPDPVDSYSDKYNYYCEAQKIAEGLDTDRTSDFGFTLLTKLFVTLPLNFYFYLLAIVYVGGIYYFCKSLSKQNSGMFFIGMLLNFMFMSYGTNTIRAGIASSILLLAIALRDKKWLSLALIIFAVSIHKSWLLPALCYLLAKYKDSTKQYFIFWVLSIPISAIFGGAIQTFFASFISDDRSGYLVMSAADTAYKVGFRVDFIIYSCVPIFVGYYYIYKRRFQDKFYKNLYNMYILANTFWIFVIRADFSDRFAYLSWFIYSVVLLYPIITQPNIVQNPKNRLGYIILGLTVFYYII